jgi:hypothetical protein
MFVWVKVILPIAGGVATLWAIAYLLKTNLSIDSNGEKVSHKNASFKIQVALPERHGILQKKGLFGCKAWYADIGWKGETVVINFFHDVEMKRIARILSLGRYFNIRAPLLLTARATIRLLSDPSHRRAGLGSE